MDLDGIRVLDLTQLLPGPYGSQLLADMGADVVKVEPPTGDPARHVRSDEGWAGHVFSAVNSGKRSVAIDLKSEAGREVFYDLASGADVVLEQFRPGVTERLGIGYETLTDHRADLVYCSLSGYGQEGPYSDRAGHDLNYTGVTGLLDMTRSGVARHGGSDGPGNRPSGDDDGPAGTGSEDSSRIDGPDDHADSDAGGRANTPPALPGYPVADTSGGLMAVTAVLGALLDRERGGGGTHLDVAMTDAILSQGQVELAAADDGRDPRAGETLLTGDVPWYDVYETADGRYVTLAALEPRFFEAFCEAVDRSDLLEFHLTRDEDERAHLRSELTDLFAGRTRAEWADLVEADTMVGPVHTPAEVLADPHFRERGLFTETDVGHRRVQPPALAEEATGVTGAVPDLGEHTDEVLAGCGYDDETVATLRESGAVR